MDFDDWLMLLFWAFVPAGWVFIIYLVVTSR